MDVIYAVITKFDYFEKDFENYSQIRLFWKGLQTNDVIYELCFREQVINFFQFADTDSLYYETNFYKIDDYIHVLSI